LGSLVGAPVGAGDATASLACLPLDDRQAPLERADALGLTRNERALLRRELSRQS
jgi:hypothetical protein